MYIYPFIFYCGTLHTLRYKTCQVGEPWQSPRAMSMVFVTVDKQHTKSILFLDF